MSYISAITKGTEVIVWERDAAGRHEQRYDAPYYFYVEDKKGQYRSIFGDRVSKVDFERPEDYYGTRNDLNSDGIRLFESDISPDLRVLSNAYYGKPAPKLHVSFFDIEVDYDPEIGFASTHNPYAPINAISIVHQWSTELVVLCVPPDTKWSTNTLRVAVDQAVKDVPVPLEYKTKFMICKDEKELLASFLVEIEDTDVLVGWNSNLFDTPYIAKRIEKVLGKRALIKLSFDGAPEPKFREIEVMNNIQITLDTFGRETADYMMLYRKYEVAEKPSYKLSSIEEEVGLGLPKLEYQGSLSDLYRKNFPFFIRYNIRDVEILYGFEKKLAYVELANQMYHISTCQFKHVTGTLKLAEFAIVNYCHHVLKQVVPNAPTSPPSDDKSAEGALVLDPKIGLHEWIGSIDINSLYPSSIRSINISPETLRGQFRKTVQAAEEIAKRSGASLVVDFEDGEQMEMTADEWREWLKEKKWAVSGYGTIFDQNQQGIIPTILAEWYATRKKYQAMMKEAEKAGEKEKAGYYDRLQYVFKIKLNSLYGALLNTYFRFFDPRMGESTTGTGRVILRHQCAKANELLTEEYDLYGEAVVYGDTDSCYFRTYAQDKQEAVEIADFIAEQVNKSFPKFMTETFLCNPEFNNIIKTGRELVSDRGIFVDKKRYILHVVDKEGKPSDSLKVMGLDTKKTTLPRPIAQQLNGFIEEFLKGKSWDDVALEIVEYKDRLRATTDPMEIGLPKGVKGITEYTNALKKDENARVPGHVMAAIHYNLCLEQFHDKVSIPITSGMKIKVFYLTTTNGRFKSIALPTDLEVVPQWFLDNFSIDYDAHIERLVDNPLENIIRAIGKRAPSRQTILIDSLFEF